MTYTPPRFIWIGPTLHHTVLIEDDNGQQCRAACVEGPYCVLHYSMILHPGMWLILDNILYGPCRIIDSDTFLAHFRILPEEEPE